MGLFGADHFASPSASHSQSQSPPEQGSQDTGGTGGDPLVEPTGEPQRKKACVQTTLPVARTENKEHSQLNVQLCRFVISANCPFSLVDDAEFARFVQLLRPGARLPTRQTLSGPVLDSVYDAELERAAGQVEGKYGTVCIDGWSSITAEPVIGISLSVAGRSFLCDTIDTSGHPHTIEYLTEIAEKAIVDIQEKFRVEVTGCVTDNAANMEGMRRALALKFPKMQNIGCCAHWLNLLMKDIAKDQTAVLERVIEVLRWFRNNHQAAACLRQRELALPPLPSTTRWNSHAESLAYFNKH